MRAEGYYEVPRNEKVDKEVDLGNNQPELEELIFSRPMGRFRD